jgi:ribosome recycling factor
VLCCPLLNNTATFFCPNDVTRHTPNTRLRTDTHTHTQIQKLTDKFGVDIDKIAKAKDSELATL